MNELNVILINRALPSNCVGRLTGRSGVEYGQSVYEEAHGAHVCRLTLAEWRACKEDVTYGMMRRWSQWEVDVEGEMANGKWQMANQGACERVGVDDLRNVKEGEGGSRGGREDGVVRSSGDEDDDEGGFLAPKAPVTARTSAATPEGEDVLEAEHDHVEEEGGFSEAELKRIGSYRKLLAIAKRVGVEDAERVDSTTALRVAILERQGKGGRGL